VAGVVHDEGTIMGIGRGVWSYGRNRAASWSLIVTIHDLERHELLAMIRILDFTHSCGRQRFGDIV